MPEMTTNCYEQENIAKAGWPGRWLVAETAPAWSGRMAAGPGSAMVLVLRCPGPGGQREPQAPPFPNRMVA